MRKALLGVAACAALLSVSVTGAVASPGGSSASASPSVAQNALSVAQSSTNLTCAQATRVANFAERRVKKQRKKWRNGFISTAKYKNGVRIWKSWLRYRNRVCSQQPGGGGGGGTTTNPLALTSGEVYNRVLAVAYQEYLIDDNAYNYGAADTSTCNVRTTYSWSCYGWNDETNGDRCWFHEVVDRVGYNGITSHRDTSYTDGVNPGWVCV